VGLISGLSQSPVRILSNLSKIIVEDLDPKNPLTKPYPIISPPDFKSLIIDIEDISDTLIVPSTSPNLIPIVPN